jgi:hypothetical protein
MHPSAEASADIAAPIALVWQIMLDLPAYGAWNPFIFRADSASSSPGPGADLTLHVRWSDGSTVSSRERIITLDPPAPGEGALRATLAYQFLGPLHTLHLVRGTRLQTLAQTPGGPTRYHTMERFHGLLRRFVPLAKVQDGFERHAAALKAAAEAAVAGSS